jgi:hypothetical protein
MSPGKLSLKMYVWEGVLADYYGGMVCVLAVSKTQALAVLKKTHEEAWKECQRYEPEVYSKPAAVCMRGGG